MSRASGSKLFSAPAQSGTAALVQTGPTTLNWYHLFNTTVAEAYLQLFDAAAAGDVIVGTTVATLVLGIPAETGAGLGSGACTSIERPVMFNKGLVIAATTTTTGSTGAICCVALGVGGS